MFYIGPILTSYSRVGRSALYIMHNKYIYDIYPNIAINIAVHHQVGIGK